jgi:hypothetical protein
MTKGKGRVQTWIVMGAAVFVVLYALVLLVHDSYRLPGKIAAESVAPIVSDTVTSNSRTSVTLLLTALNNSGEEGKVILSALEAKTLVVISLAGGSSTPQPAHIHTGGCPEVGAVRYQLENVVNGKSETILNEPLTAVLSGLPVAVNVHKSVQDTRTYVACGAFGEF